MPVNKGLPCGSCAHTPAECLIAAEVRQINRRDHLTLRSIYSTGSENTVLLCNTRRYSSFLGGVFFTCMPTWLKKWGEGNELKDHQYIKKKSRIFIDKREKAKVRLT